MFTFNSTAPIMQITIKNLGIIESAHIELNGLTILTGENDTGKSFISKIVFSIVKTLKEAERRYNRQLFDGISLLLQQAHSVHRSALDFTSPREIQFSLSNFLSVLYTEFLQERLDTYKTTLLIDGYLRSILADLHSYFESTIQGEKDLSTILIPLQEEINKISQTIDKTLNNKVSKNAIYKSYFDKIIIENLFLYQINKSRSDSVLEIIVKEGESTLLEITIKNNKVVSFIETNPMFFTDCTIIETPTILQIDRFIINSLALNNHSRNVLPEHYTDLVQKISTFKDESPVDFVENELIAIDQVISDIIGGEIVYNPIDRTIYYETNSSGNISTQNLASGIKSFGLLKLLNASGNITSNSILIIDEPEVHLHPKWEIEYAKIVSLLVKAGIPIIISTHSPYMIKALTVYAKKYEIVNKVKVYYGEKSNRKSNFTDITTNLEPFLNTLSEPFTQLFKES